MKSKVAIIDCGTNTFNILIAAKKKLGFETYFEDEVSVRIGNQGISQNTLTDDAIERALTVLKNFKKIIDVHKVPAHSIFAFATSAFRNARNGNLVKSIITKETGINIQIIQGSKEAELIFKGVNRAVEIKEPVLVMDIGGGSVEFIIGDSSGVIWKESFEIGAQRLIDRFQPQNPISQKELVVIKDYLIQELKSLFDHLILYLPDVLIGASGTFETLSDIYRSRESIKTGPSTPELPFQIGSFDKIYEEIINKSHQHRQQIPGMTAMRVDMIVMATTIIHSLMLRYQFKEFRVSRYALKEGALFQLFERRNKTN